MDLCLLDLCSVESGHTQILLHPSHYSTAHNNDSSNNSSINNNHNNSNTHSKSRNPRRQWWLAVLTLLVAVPQFPAILSQSGSRLRWTPGHFHLQAKALYGQCHRDRLKRRPGYQPPAQCEAIAGNRCSRPPHRWQMQ